MKKQHHHNGKKISLRMLDRHGIDDLEVHEMDCLKQAMENDDAVKDYVDRTKDASSSRSYAALQKRIAERNKTSPAQWLADQLSSVKARPAFAAAVMCVVALVTGYGILQRIDSSSTYSIKGSSMDLAVAANGESYEPGELISVSSTDTVSLDYRSVSDVFVWFVIREDTKDAALLSEQPVVWSAAGKTRSAPQQLVMEGAWERQQLWVVFSDDRMSSERVRHLIERERKRESVEVFSFYFVKDQN